VFPVDPTLHEVNSSEIRVGVDASHRVTAAI